METLAKAEKKPGCSFFDVEDRPDGRYECSRCGAILDRDWLDRMRRAYGKRTFNRLNSIRKALMPGPVQEAER